MPDLSRPPKPLGFTIQTFAPLGEPEGLKIIERDNWNGLLLEFSATKGQTDALARPELSRSGVYLLLDDGEETQAIPRLYIGEGDVLKKRLPGSMAQRDYWTRAIVCTAKDDSLTKAHALHLEARLIALARKASQANLDQNDTHAQLTGAEAEKAERYLELLLEVLPLIGVTAFEIATPTEETTQDRLFLAERGATASARETGEGFVVEEGSVASPEETNSMPDFIGARRRKLINNGILAPKGGTLILKEDQIFKSSSTAAAVLTGSSISGPRAWKDSGGKSLKERQDELAETEAGDHDDAS